MADSGSFNAEAEIKLQVNLDDSGLVELAKTIKEISKGNDLQKYWKDVETATNNAEKAMKNYSKNISSDNLAKHFLKEINALKALTGKENLSELFPDIDLNFEELINSAKKTVPKINSEFSVENFSQAFNTFELLQKKGLDLTKIFSNLSDYTRVFNRNLELRNENSELKEIIGDNDIEEIKEKISEIRKLREQAENIFESFLDLNNINKLGYDSYGWYVDNRFEDYFKKIQNGTYSAQDAIRAFKSEYAYLLEENFKVNNDNFGLERLQEFSTKLENILHKVEETSSKINDIISNGVITKSIENLNMDSSLSDSQRSMFGNILNDEESLKSITTLFQNLIDESNKSSKVEIFNDEQLQKVLSIFERIEDHLYSLKKVVSDIGDGEELSPLLKMLDNIRKETSNIKLSFNMDLGEEVSERLNQKISQATSRQLEAYRELFSAIKGTGKTNKEMIQFFEPDDASVTELIGMYKGIIERAEKQFKTGRGSIYKKYLGSEYDTLKKEITNSNKQLSRADSKKSESGILGDLFGNTRDLSEVISHLNIIVEKLDKIVSFIPEFKNTFKDGINVNASVEEIEKLTNKVKELEDELSKIKNNNSIGSNKTNISSVREQVEYDAKVAEKQRKEEEKILKAQYEERKKEQEEYQKLREKYENEGKRQEQDFYFSGYDEASKFNKQLDKAIKNTNDLISEHSKIKEIQSVYNVLEEKVNDLNSQLKNGSVSADEYNKSIKKIVFDAEKKAKEETKPHKKRESNIESFRKKAADFLIKPDEQHRLQSWANRIDDLNKLIDEYAEKSKFLKENNITDPEETAKVDQLGNEIKDLIATMNKTPQGDRGYTDLSVSKAMEKINADLEKYSGMHPRVIKQIKAMYNELKSGNLTRPISEYIDEVNRLIQMERTAGRAHKSFVDIFKEKVVYGAAGQLAGMFGFYDVINLGRQAIDTIIELDDALLDLKKTTVMSSVQLEEFYFDSNDVAKQMGVTTKEIIDQASAWSRLGYNTKEASTQMAQLSSQFASISPGMDVNTAQEGLVSIMKAWNIDVSDVESEIMDNINALGNSMAEDNQDIVEGMKRSAAALASVGTSYKDAFAMFSGIQEVLQNAEVSGRALRSISMRIRGYDESTEEKTDELKNITGDLIDLTKTAEHSEGISIFKEGSTTEFKDLVDYFGEIHEIWNEMSQKQQNDFLQKAFGKTQAQAGAALIQNYDAVTKALEVMEESAGSADREMEVVEQSLTYKINALEETWTGTFQNIIDRGDLGIIIDGLTKLSEAIGFVVDKLGLFGTIGLGAGAFAGFKNVGVA